MNKGRGRARHPLRPVSAPTSPPRSIFTARKNYFYPTCQGYQINQYEIPVGAKAAR